MASNSTGLGQLAHCSVLIEQARAVGVSMAVRSLVDVGGRVRAFASARPPVRALLTRLTQHALQADGLTSGNAMQTRRRAEASS